MENDSSYSVAAKTRIEYGEDTHQKYEREALRHLMSKIAEAA
jgi:hypothetical protein